MQKLNEMIKLTELMEAHEIDNNINSINDDIIIYNKMLEGLNSLLSVLEDNKGKKLTNHISNKVIKINPNIEMNVYRSEYSSFNKKNIRISIKHKPFRGKRISHLGEFMESLKYKESTRHIITWLDEDITDDTISNVKIDIKDINKKIEDLKSIDYIEDIEEIKKSYNNLIKKIEEHNKLITHDLFNDYYIRRG